MFARGITPNCSRLRHQAKRLTSTAYPGGLVFYVALHKQRSAQAGRPMALLALEGTKDFCSNS